MKAKLWKRVAKKYFRSRLEIKHTAQSLKVAERGIRELVKDPHPGQNVEGRLRIALDAIQPLACAYNDDLAEELHPLHVEYLDATSARFRGEMPHWAMKRLAQSLAQSMMEAPNYQTCTLETGQTDGPRFEMVLRQIGKGRTAHELREEAEKEQDAARALLAEGRVELEIATDRQTKLLAHLRACQREARAEKSRADEAEAKLRHSVEAVHRAAVELVKKDRALATLGAGGRLACTRCGAEVSRSYEPERCYAEDCEPQEMDAHDVAEPWEDVHGTPRVEEKTSGNDAASGPPIRSAQAPVDQGKPAARDAYNSTPARVPEEAGPVKGEKWFASGRGIFRGDGAFQVACAALTVNWQEDTEMLVRLLNAGERVESAVGELRKVVAEIRMFLPSCDWADRLDAAMGTKS